MSTPKSDGAIVIFATIVCVICSMMLSVTASTLKTKQDYNVELDRKLNVLKAFGEPTVDENGKTIPGSKVDEIFHTQIHEIVLDGESGTVLEGKTSADFSAGDIADRKVLLLYVWEEDGQAKKYAFPISGKGLWSTIYGYLALDKDLATIVGVTFYRHGETPGLGGEVSADWFQAQFKGKKVYEGGNRLKFEVVKGLVADRYPNGNNHAVDGMSGATITGKGVSHFINADLDKYEKYFSLKRST